MIRTTVAPRPDWQARVEAEGLIWHTADGRPYWDESACYRFSAAQVAAIEDATAELYRLFLAAGDAIVASPDLLDRFGVPAPFHDAVRGAWEAEPPALNYGRFDLGYNGVGAPKLFEFNCDTPTSLLEAAVIQWSWKAQCFPDADQFNSLHERLVDRWRELAPRLPACVHFAHAAEEAGEDAVTTAYLRDTAEAAGIATLPVVIEALGWDAQRRRFVDEDERPVAALFKLYPWEWLAAEAFAGELLESLDHMLWIEPVWKMIWSNKAVLAVLWDLFPGHPNLLPAGFDIPEGDAVAKPLLAREGANVSIRRGGAVVAEKPGDYGAEGYVYQALYSLPECAPGCFPVIGSWVVDGVPAGMGIREDGLITGNTARFVPHLIDGWPRNDSPGSRVWGRTAGGRRMNIIKLPPGEDAPEESDCISIERLPDGRFNLQASALINCGDSDEAESIGLVGGISYHSFEAAEAAGMAWAEAQCVEELYVSTRV